MFKMISAAITPGIHPTKVRMNTMRTEPHPRSNTAKGGKMMESMTLNTDMNFCLKSVGKGNALFLYGET